MCVFSTPKIETKGLFSKKTTLSFFSSVMHFQMFTFRKHLVSRSIIFQKTDFCHFLIIALRLDLYNNDELRLHRKDYFNYYIGQLACGWSLKICKSHPKGWLFLLMTINN